MAHKIKERIRSAITFCFFVFQPHGLPNFQGGISFLKREESSIAVQLPDDAGHSKAVSAHPPFDVRSSSQRHKLGTV
jgi:hypothetical protein